MLLRLVALARRSLQVNCKQKSYWKGLGSKVWLTCSSVRNNSIKFHMPIWESEISVFLQTLLLIYEEVVVALIQEEA